MLGQPDGDGRRDERDGALVVRDIAQELAEVELGMTTNRARACRAR